MRQPIVSDQVSLATASSAMKTKTRPSQSNRSRPENSWPSAQVKASGRRLNAKAVVSTMPTVKATPTIAAVFFMAVLLFWLW